MDVGFGALSLTAVLSAAMMKAVGEPAMDSASLAGQTLGNVVAGIEIVHGIVVLLDPKATNAQKEHAAFSIASGGAWFIGKQIGKRIGDEAMGGALGATMGA